MLVLWDEYNTYHNPNTVVAIMQQNNYEQSILDKNGKDYSVYNIQNEVEGFKY